MNVLLSIKPEYAEKILSGEKCYEFRKVAFKNPDVKKVIIYATMPVGKVIGEFEISDILTKEPNELWEITKNQSGITKAFFDEYYRDRSKGVAIKVGKFSRYSTPKLLNSLIKSGQAPQSFCYLPAA